MNETFYIVWLLFGLIVTFMACVAFVKVPEDSDRSTSETNQIVMFYSNGKLQKTFESLGAVKYNEGGHYFTDRATNKTVVIAPNIVITEK